MKKALCTAMALFVGLLLVSAAWAIQPYLAPIKEITDAKGVIDDPAPFYTKTNYYKQFIPDEAWQQLAFDPEESTAAWEKAIGFRAKDVVGKIAPEIKPGRYTLSDKEKYPFKELMTEYHYKRFNAPGTEGLPNHIGMFTEFEVIPTQQLWYAKPLAEATIKNMGTTQLDKDGYIKPETYISGFPFPRPSGEHLPMELLYNWEKRFKDCESTANYDLTIGVNGRGNIDHRGTAHYFMLRLEGRVVMPPYGWFDERAKRNGEEQARMFTIYSPRDLYGNIYNIIAYTDPKKDRNFLAYVNFLRRIRKLSSTDTQDQAVGQDISFDDAEGFSQALRPDRYPYKCRVIADREYLVPAYTFDASDYLDSNDGWKWKGLKFERRPMWVIEMVQQDKNYLYSRRVGYFDKETLLPQLWEMYDQKGRYYRTMDREWGMVVPMGYINTIHDNNCDWIDTHCTLTFSPGYPALWLGRSDMSLKTMMKQK